MEAFIDPALPWALKSAIALAGAIVIALGMLAVPKKVLARISQWPLCSANWLTAWSIVCYFIGIPIYVYVDFYVGSWFLVVGGVLDVLDGKMAVAQEEFGVFRSEASKEFGEIFDPFADKVRQLTTIAVMCFRGAFMLPIVIMVILVDVFGTLIRKPFIRFWPFSHIKKHVRQSKASAVGKVKSLVQIFAIVFAAPYERGWVDPGIFPDVVLSIALVLGILSVISRIKISRDVDRVVDEAHSYFRHQDV
jgi:phosphatidylglycerophosphate synthase